jgi:uncharacterized protein YecE (DUF72 family)
MGTEEANPHGYAQKALDKWTERAQTWAAGGAPDDLDTYARAAPKKARDVYLFVISGHKAHNPAAAMALIERIKAEQ